MTLARLLQAVTLGALLLAAGWAGWQLQAGRPGWAVAGAALLLGGYALLLALEFTLLRLVHGDDPTPRATAAQLLQAFWGEVRSAPLVFCWRQPFRSQLHPDNASVAPSKRRGVLLIHGFVCNRGLWNPWLHKLKQDGVPFAAVNLEPVFGGIDVYVQPIDAAMRKLEQATGLPPVVVAHSMGGLALRRWCAEPGNTARIHRAITIGTPHHGTWLARFAFTANARQMQQRSRWLQALQTREPADLGTRFTCFFSHCDNIVFPPRSATLDGADNRHLAGQAHVHMADRPEPWAELLRWISPAQLQPEHQPQPAAR
jgi:predicted alpha/beta hydrolase family esterase